MGTPNRPHIRPSRWAIQPDRRNSKRLCRLNIVVQTLPNVQDLVGRDLQFGQCMMKDSQSGFVALCLLGCNYMSKPDAQQIARFSK